MTKLLTGCLAALLLLSACQKAADAIIERATGAAAATATTDGFVSYTIKVGEHYSDKNAYKPVDVRELHFLVQFDSSAIYQTVSPSNQNDINKLYGFSDNGAQHHQFSARFGWRWSGGALRLFGYVYNGGTVVSKELKAIAIGAAADCNLQVTATHYRFTVNGATDSLPRLSRTPLAKGYQLYPYFGGDEAAPHPVTIGIKELK